MINWHKQGQYESLFEGLLHAYSKGELKTGLWLARNEGICPYSNPYNTHEYGSFHFLVHSFISS